MLLKTILFFGLILSPLSSKEPLTIDPTEVIKLKFISEPSGISCSEDYCVIVSDDGKMFNYDYFSRKISRINFQGEDLEGVYTTNQNIFVLEERSRKVEKFDRLYNHIQTYNVPYNGRLNRGYEGITFNPESNRFIIVTETNPCMLVELNEFFEIQKKKQLDINELSDITYYQNKYWLLSEQDHCIYVVNPINYETEKIFNINLLGAEGICFFDQKLLITSDKLSKLYIYVFPKL